MTDAAIVREIRSWRQIIRRVIEKAAHSTVNCRDRVRGLSRDPPGARDPGDHLAVDGGSKIVEYSGFVFYIARSWARSFPRGKPRSLAAAGVVLPPVEPDVQVGYMREALEAQAALDAMTGYESLVLLDGSVTGVLRWYRPGFGGEYTMRQALADAEETARWLVEEGHASMLGYTGDCGGPGRYPCLSRLIRGSRERPVAGKMAMLAAAFEAPYGLDWTPAVEVAEKLYLYMRLFEEAWGRGARVVFVSKKSNRRRICRGAPHSDAHYVEKHVDAPALVVPEPPARRGYTEIMDLRGQGTRAFLPDILGIPGFYESRLAAAEAYLVPRRGQVLHVDVVYDPSRARGVDELEEGVSLLLGAPSSGGYPVSLNVAHRHARVLEQALQVYLRGAGLEKARLARSMLGV